MFISNQTKTLSKHILSYLYTGILILTFFSFSTYASEVDEYESTVTISPKTITVTEGDSGTKNVNITISLDSCPEYSDIKLRYYTSNGTANTGDYISRSGNIVFPKNGTSCSQTITVQIKGDTSREDDQHFYLNFRDNGTHSLQQIEWSNGQRATITIENDDIRADLRVRKHTVHPSNINSYVYWIDYDIGDEIVYRVRGDNRGEDPTTVSIVDTLPPGFEVTSVTDDFSNFGCSVSGHYSTGQTVTCSGSRIFNKDELVSVFIRGIARTAGTYTNHANISSPDGVYDHRPWNNNTSHILYTDAPGGNSRPLIDKSVDDNSPEVGDVVTFTLTATNRGFPKRIVIRDRLPVTNYSWGTTAGAFSFVPGSIVSPPDVTCEIVNSSGDYPYLQCASDNDLVDGESFTVTFQANILSSNGRAADGYAICNRVHVYRYLWSHMGSDRICLNARSAHPPVLADLPNQESNVGETVSIDLGSYASDPDGDTIIFSATNLPPGLSITSDGVIYGEPSDSGANTYTVTITIVDVPIGGEAPVSVQKTFDYTIVYPDVQAYDNQYTIETNNTLTGNIITDTDSTNTNADTGYNIQITSNSAIDADDGVITIASDGDFTFIPNSTFLGDVTFTYTIADSNGDESNATVTISVGTDFEDGFQPFVLINPPDTRNVLGNFAIAGNTVECISDSQTNFNGTCTDNSALLSNDYVTKYIDIDDDNTTWNSSSSYVNLPNSYDHQNKGILWAGLFWQGRYTSNAVAPNGVDKIIRYGIEGSGNFTYGTSISASDINNISSFNPNKIKLKINTGNSFDSAAPYQDITALTLYSNRNNGGVSYAAFADITTLLQTEMTQTGDYTFTVANLGTAEGWENDPGLYGGWSLVVIYAEDFSGKVRNISIFSGYDQIDATNKPETIIPISGFKLPKANAINSTLGIFSGEGEYPLGNASGEYDRVQLSTDGATYEYPNSTDPQRDNVFDAMLTNIDRENIAGKFNDLSNNNSGLDIDFLNISSLMEGYRDLDPNINSVHIKMETNKDTINPSMLVFATELYVPKLCYNYSYQQYGITFTHENNGSEPARIVGERIVTEEPVTVELYIKNDEKSDAVLNNLKLNITDINASQAFRISDSTYVIEAGQSTPKHIEDSDVTSSSTTHISGVPLGNIDAQDYVYIDYDLNPQVSELDMPINASIDFTLDLLGGITYDLTVFLSSMELCEPDFSYNISYKSFNVEDEVLSATPYYDLPTQIVRRVGNYKVTSYNYDENTTSVDNNIRKDINVTVAVDLIDAVKYQDADAACQEPDNSLSPRVWVTLENANSTNFNRDVIQDAIDNGLISDSILGDPAKISSAEEFYRYARKSMAFRVSSNEYNNSLISVTPVSSTHYTVSNFPDYSSEDLGNGVGYCAQNIGGVPTTFASQCQNALDGSAVSKAELASCMECIYGVSTSFSCSRDNFAMRPKGFRLSLVDQNQTDSSTPPTNIGINNIDKIWNLVSGYNYRLDINATSFTDNDRTLGYINYFETDASDPDKLFTFDWENVSGITTNCQNTDDINQSASFLNGISAENNISSDEVGRYALSLLDREYTKHDWKEKYMQHQKSNSRFLSGIDCLQGDATAQEENIPTGISSPDLSNVNGCNISSNVTGDIDYIDMTLQIYPYTFNVDGLANYAGRQPGVNSPFIYINNAPTNTLEDQNMSYNFNGTYFAAGYNDARATNFTTGCWAENTDMSLGVDYISAIPTAEPNLTYSLRDINTSNPATIYRPIGGGNAFDSATDTNATTPFVIGQDAGFYANDMAGAITMNLGFNFQRPNRNTPLEPRLLQFNDFNITYRNNPAELWAEGTSSFIIEGRRDLNATRVSFVYGRTKPSQYLYDNITANSVTTPISTLMYCSLGLAECQNRGLANISNGLLSNARSNESNWWYVESHVENDDGYVRIATPNNGGITVDFTAGINETIVINNDAGNPTPNILDINLTTDNTLGAGFYTNRWLIFNPDADANPVPFYRVRFIGSGGWTGEGKTGNVVGDRINVKKTRRLEF